MAVVMLLLCWPVAAEYALGDAEHSHPAGLTTKPAVQIECPVMAGQEIDPRIYSDYQGHRVYFCCLTCKMAFDENPGKYLSRLPQFATGEMVEEEEDEQHESLHMELIEIMGAVTLVLLITTVCLALLRRAHWAKPGAILKFHKIAGVSTLCSGLIHAALVILH
jgi:YHS domain-containing protein